MHWQTDPVHYYNDYLYIIWCLLFRAGGGALHVRPALFVFALGMPSKFEFELKKYGETRLWKK
jgi:hypothetical protein